MRERTKDLRNVIHIGTLYRRGITPDKLRSIACGSYHESHDVIGNQDGENQLDLRRQDMSWLRLNGENKDARTGVIYSRFTNYPVTNCEAPVNPKTYWDLQDGNPLLRFQEFALAIATRLNPATPMMSLPTSLAELKDLPDLVPWKVLRTLGDLPNLVKHWGTTLLRGVAAGHLTWRFALKPMLGDIRKLLKFQKVVAKRFALLEKLKDGREKGRWVRRKSSLSREGFFQDDGSRILQSEAALVTAKRYTILSKDEWITARWKLSNDVVLPEDDVELAKLAARLCYGVTSFELLQSAWELMPWSWLVDWFVPVGDIIASFNNSLPCVQTGGCWCRTTQSKSRYYSVTTPSWVTYDGSSDLEYVVKERLPIPTSYAYLFPPMMPALTSGQLSILASLAVLKFKGSILDPNDYGSTKRTRTLKSAPDWAWLHRSGVISTKYYEAARLSFSLTRGRQSLRAQKGLSAGAKTKSVRVSKAKWYNG